jgi:hypothetical protein
VIPQILCLGTREALGEFFVGHGHD